VKLSEAGALRIANYEGFVANAYWDVDHYSIGYGTRARSASEGPISMAEGRKRLLRHADGVVGVALREVLREAKLTLNQNQFDACVSAGYNLGTGLFGEGWQFGKALRARDLDAIAEAFLRESYASADGVVLAGLVRRRREEHDLFLKKPPIAYTDKERHLLKVLRDKTASKTRRQRAAASLRAQHKEILENARAEKDGWAKHDRGRRYQGIRRALRRYA
jgi:GH24 family phage-related lysozyme (muramidase)